MAEWRNVGPLATTCACGGLAHLSQGGYGLSVRQTHDENYPLALLAENAFTGNEEITNTMIHRFQYWETSVFQMKNKTGQKIYSWSVLVLWGTVFHKLVYGTEVEVKPGPERDSLYLPRDRHCARLLDREGCRKPMVSDKWKRIDISAVWAEWLFSFGRAICLLSGKR